MKPIVLSLLLVLGVLLGFAWMNGDVGNLGIKKATVAERVLYFEPTVDVEFEKEKEINLMINNSRAPVVGFKVEIQYDIKTTKVLGFEINKEVFDSLISSNIDENAGKVSIIANRKKNFEGLVGGVQKLATIRVLGIKKGTLRLGSEGLPKVTVFEAGKQVESVFQMQEFKVGIK